MFDFIDRFVGYFKGERKVIADNGDTKLVKVKSCSNNGYEAGLLRLYSTEELTPEQIAAIIKENLGSILEDGIESNNIN